MQYMEETAKEEANSPFSRIRHHIGRLSRHVAVPLKLLDDALHVDYLLQESTVVRAVPELPSAPRPPPDQMTTGASIVKRMLPEGDRRLEEYQAFLIELDRQHQMDDRIRDFFDDMVSSPPQVHCEIQVHEHFYRSRLAFLDNDPFIACSKPACLCCRLYIEHHAFGCVLPASHQKVWPNWGPPSRPEDCDDDSEEFKVHRDVLQKITEELRRDALKQIRDRRQPLPSRFDSTTGITSNPPLQNFDSFKAALATINEESSASDTDGK